MTIQRTPHVLGLFSFLLVPAPGYSAPGDLVLPPDYRQVRPGLPACDDPVGSPGGNYCGPTATANLLQWMTENGFPLLSGPGRPPENCNSDYADAVTNFIDGLGEQSFTDPCDGTGSQDITNTLTERLNFFYSGRFTVGYDGRARDGLASRALGHNFATAVAHMNAGRLLLINVGWYRMSDGLRCGGHWITMTGYDNVNPAQGEYVARFRNPSRDCETISKKDIVFEERQIEEKDGSFRCQAVSVWNWILGCSDCSGPVKRIGIQDNILYVAESILLSSEGTPAATTFNLARGTASSLALAGPPACMAMHPSLLEVYYGVSGDAAIHSVRLDTGASSIVSHEAALFQPRQLVFTDEATLLVLDDSPAGGATLHAIGDDGAVRGAVSRPTITAMAYHESLDQVYVWDGPAGTVEVFAPDLSAQLATATLPLDAAFAPPGRMAADPTSDRIYYNHAASDDIFVFDMTAAAQPPISSPALSDPADMALDNSGRLYVAGEALGPVLTFVDGVLEEVSPANAFNASGLLVITRASRRPINENYTGGNLNNVMGINPGDLNEDGEKDDTDLRMFVELLLGQASDPNAAQAADFDFDLQLTGEDIPGFTDEFFVPCNEAAPVACP